jgi:hypothetical protein
MHRYLVAAAALVGACGMAHADVPELGGTVWVIIEGPAPDLCTIDEIDFAPDGTATVYFVGEDDGEAATWTQDGASVKLSYSLGDVSGTVAADRLEAVDTWQSTKANEVHHNVCIFEPG